MIAELVRNGGLTAFAAVGWYLFFKRDARVEKLEDDRMELAKSTTALSQHLADALERLPPKG